MQSAKQMTQKIMVRHESAIHSSGRKKKGTEFHPKNPVFFAYASD
jgi:hypothetical protein